MKVQLHIEELLLNGFDPRDRHRIADAVERELARLISQTEFDQFSSSIPNRESHEKLDAGTVVLPSGAPPPNAGRQIARAVHSVLQGSGAWPVVGGQDKDRGKSK